MSDSTTDNQLAIPAWLGISSHPSHPQPVAGATSSAPSASTALTPADRKDIVEQERLLAFEWVIPRVARGSSVTYALQEYYLDIDVVAFRRWIMKDPIRKALYEDAKECNADYDSGMLNQLASGINRDGIPYDPAYINAASAIIKWKMSKYNRKQYGDVKQIDVSGGISISQALADAQGRVLEGQAVAIEEEVIEFLDEPQVSPDDPIDGDDDE